MLLLLPVTTSLQPGQWTWSFLRNVNSSTIFALLPWTKCFGTPSGLRNQSMADSTIMNAMLKAGHKAQTDWEKTHIRKLPTIQTIKAIKGFRQGQKAKLAACQKRVASNPLGQNPSFKVGESSHTSLHPHVHTSRYSSYVHASLHLFVHSSLHWHTSTSFIHSFIHSYIHTFIHSYIHTFIHSYIHTYIRTYVHTYIRTYVHTYIRTYVHTYIDTLKHRYIET